jgi:hypothetical protein
MKTRRRKVTPQQEMKKELRGHIKQIVYIPMTQTPPMVARIVIKTSQ